MSTQWNFFMKLNNKNEAAVKASFQVAHHCQVAKQGKSFRDDLIKLYLMAAAKEVCVEEGHLFKTVSGGTAAQS